MKSIYKIIWFNHSDRFKVFYHVDYRPGFFYVTDEVDEDMKEFMENSEMSVLDFQTEWHF